MLLLLRTRGLVVCISLQMLFCYTTGYNTVIIHYWATLLFFKAYNVFFERGLVSEMRFGEFLLAERQVCPRKEALSTSEFRL